MEPRATSGPVRVGGNEVFTARTHVGGRVPLEFTHGSRRTHALSLVVSPLFARTANHFLVVKMPAQPNGAPWPAQVGVACSSGLEFTTHSVRAVLDENPTWVDVALDAKNAFNSIHRRTFLKVIGERFPSLWNWVWSNYGEPTELYVSSTFGVTTCNREVLGDLEGEEGRVARVAGGDWGGAGAT